MTLQYYKNQLELITLEDGTLHQVLTELREAVKRATAIIKINVPEPLPKDKNTFGTIYNGTLGMCPPELMHAKEIVRVEHAK